MKDDFLATLSHELRTPLSSILIWAKMLRRRPDAPPEYKEALEAITNSAEAQKQLIDDLLDTSRIASGKLRVEMRPVDLGPLVRSSVDAILPTASAKGVAVSTDLATDVTNAWVDPDRLRQVLWNLLTNAVKFTPPDGKVTVSCSLQPPANPQSALRTPQYVTLSITDTGIGIPKDFLPHLFEPFRQADPSATRTYGGLGLGLAICKQLVELHGGTISASSPGPNQGATFTVRLPLPTTPRTGVAGRSRGVSAPVAGQPAAAITPATLQGKRVLLIEDEPATRDALVMLLRDAGAHVTVTGSVAAATDAFTAHRPDLVISDIALPDGDGYHLISRLRSLESAAPGPDRRHTPAVALTAFARSGDRDRALAAGFDHHLGKPVDPEHLLSTLQSLLPG